VVATVVVSHARGVGWFLVVAPARGGRLRVTPCSTKQRGVLPNCQYQHDGKYNCSKHVMLAGVNGKKDANQHAASSPENSRLSALSIHY